MGVPPDRIRTSAGFVLTVEVAVALFVVSIGVVAAVALIASAMRADAASGADLRAALFAESVLNGLRAESDRAARTNDWEGFWLRTENGETHVSLAASGLWANSNATVRCGGVHAIAFTNAPIRAGGNSRIVSHALRYSLNARRVPDTAGGHGRADVVLRVWDGEFGAANDSLALRFYTELRNWGDL